MSIKPILITHQDPDKVTEFDLMIGDDEAIYVRFEKPDHFEKPEDYANHIANLMTFFFYESKVKH